MTPDEQRLFTIFFFRFREDAEYSVASEGRWFFDAR